MDTDRRVPSAESSRIPDGPDSRKATYSSAWVGLDGYADGTVEQIGTEQDWTGSKQQNYVWFEMYPSAGYEITGFPANPGDLISAQVVYLGPTQVQVVSQRKKSVVTEYVFQLTIINNNPAHPASYTVPTSYTTTTAAPARSSAEWIVEAPSSSRGILPLANFLISPVTFSECQATGLHETGSIIGTWPYDPLTMIDPSGGGAAPSSLTLGGTVFSVTYQ